MWCRYARMAASGGVGRGIAGGARGSTRLRAGQNQRRIVALFPQRAATETGWGARSPGRSQYKSSNRERCGRRRRGSEQTEFRPGNWNHISPTVAAIAGKTPWGQRLVPDADPHRCVLQKTRQTPGQTGLRGRARHIPRRLAQMRRAAGPDTDQQPGQVAQPRVPFLPPQLQNSRKSAPRPPSRTGRGPGAVRCCRGLWRRAAVTRCRAAPAAGRPRRAPGRAAPGRWPRPRRPARARG